MPLYQPLFRALNASGTRYVVVGEVATVLHGYARLTADVDLILDLERHAAARAMRALVALGLRPRVPVNTEDFADERARESWVRDKGMRVFSLYKPDNPLLAVDVFAEHPVDFEGLFERRACARSALSRSGSRRSRTSSTSSGWRTGRVTGKTSRSSKRS